MLHWSYQQIGKSEFVAPWILFTKLEHNPIRVNNSPYNRKNAKNTKMLQCRCFGNSIETRCLEPKFY